MYTEIDAFFQQVAQLHTDIQDLINAVGTLSSGQRQELQTAHTKVTGLQNSLDRMTGQALLVSEQNLFAQASFGLDRVDDIVQALTAWNVTCQQTHDAAHRQIWQVMGTIPTTVWDEMSRYYYGESVSDINKNGPGTDGRIGWIWDQYGLLNNDTSDNVRHYQYASTHGLGGLANQLQQQGYDLNAVGQNIWAVDGLMLQFKQNVYMLTTSQLTSAYTLADICHQTTTATPAAPVKATISMNQADQLAQMMHSDIRSAFLLQEDLQQYHLNPADVAELEQAYLKRYGQSLESDLWNGGVDSQYQSQQMGLYEIYSILHPENIQPQQFINNTLAGPSHIIMDPPMDVVPVGTMPPYQFWSGLSHSSGKTVVFAIANDDAKKNGSPAMLSPNELFSDGFPKPGSYTIVVEEITDPNKAPIFHTYTQQVMPADQLAVGTLASMASSGPWPSSADYLNGLKQAAQKDSSLQGAYQKALGLLDSSCTPIPSVFTSTSRQSQNIPMSVYMKKTKDGYQIIDLTNPNDIRTYQGSSMDNAWHDFIQNNMYPDGGQIAALPPKINGQSMSWKLWNKPNNDHSAGHVASKIFMALSMITMVIGFVFPPAFIASGAFGAVSGGLDIADQVEHGDWSWDGAHFMEIAGVALNFGFITEGLADVSKIYMAAKAADGSQTLTVMSRATKTFEMGGKIITKGSMFTMGITIAAPYVQQVNDIITKGLASGQSWDAILKQISGVVGDAALSSGMQLAMVGLPLAPDMVKVASLFGKSADEMSGIFDKINNNELSASDLQTLADKAGISTDLLKEIASDPSMQSALQGMGPQQLTDLYTQYQHDILPQVEAGQSDLTFKEYLFSTHDTVPEGQVPGIDLYQQTQLNTLLDDPNGIPNQAGLSAQQMADFDQRLRGDPQLQKALVDNNNGDLQKLENAYKDWSTQGGANAAKLTDRDLLTFLSDHHQMSVDVGDRTTCGQSAITLDRTMGNEPVPTGTTDGYMSPTQMANALGKDPSQWAYAANQDQLIQMLEAQGPGARAIVYGSRGADDVGHYFNIVNDDGTIRIIDGQTHQPVNLADFKDFSVLQTADGTTDVMAASDMSPHLSEVGGASNIPMQNRNVTLDIDAAGRTKLYDLFGRNLDNYEIWSLVGAPDGATVKVVDSGYGELEITLEGPNGSYKADRELYRDANGKLVMHNAYFRIQQTGTGLGAQVFADEVDSLTNLGVSQIETDAARSATFNGYYTWPRLGYDAPLPWNITSILPPSLSNCSTVQDLFKTQEGRDWWKQNGIWMNGMVFDLTPGSLSQRILHDYLASKNP